MVKWFDKWFQKQCKKAWENSSRDEHDRDEVQSTKYRDSGRRLSKITDEDIINDRQCYTLKMQPAAGGTILQISHYNVSADEWNSDMFVVDEHKDLGKELMSILVQYRLKHL